MGRPRGVWCRNFPRCQNRVSAAYRRNKNHDSRCRSCAVRLSRSIQRDRKLTPEQREASRIATAEMEAMQKWQKEQDEVIRQLLDASPLYP